MKEIEISYPIYFDKRNKNGIIYDEESYREALSKQKEYELYYLTGNETNRIYADIDYDKLYKIGTVKYISLEDQNAIIEYYGDYDFSDKCLGATLTGKLNDDNIFYIEDIKYFYTVSKKASAWCRQTNPDIEYTCKKCNTVICGEDIKYIISTDNYICPMCDTLVDKSIIQEIAERLE